MKPVSFFSDDIEILPHSATHKEHVSKRVSIRNFAAGRPVSLYEMDNGNLRAVVYGSGDFIEGPEVV